MACAHRVFTADSVAWLGYHTDPERPAPTIARWAMSLLMIRAVLTGVSRAGWETADVWDRVLRTAPKPSARGRLAADPAMRRLAVAVRGGWDDPAQLHERLSADQRRLLGRYEEAVAGVTDEWPAATATGPAHRHGLALAVTFHWNRSGMPPRHRHLLATALAAARPTPVAA
jgi:hypothetical protein